MPGDYPITTRSRRSSASTESGTAASGRSSHSSHTEYTDHAFEHLSQETEPSPKCDLLNCGREHEANARYSSETYSSTAASSDDGRWPISGSCPWTRPPHYYPDAIGSTPAEFGLLFPSGRRLLIQHDDTTADGNLNLRVDTEITATGERHRSKLTLFHLRMYDLAERHFSLRRYQRQSGREVCTVKRKYVTRTPSSASPKRTLANLFGTIRPSAPSPTPRPPHSARSTEGVVEDGRQHDVVATVPTTTIKIEFSNYAQVELLRCRRGDGKMYDFEYWGERYTWRRSLYRDGGESVFCLELVHFATGKCIAHITPDKLSPRHTRQEISHGGWIPPCSMRITARQMSQDLADVVVATGLIALTDDCIQRYWSQTHRH